MTVVFRNDDTRWGLGAGAGVGGKLTSLQADENSYEFLTRIAALEDADGPVSIASIEVSSNGNTITVNLTDGSTAGPFALPMAMINPVGEWQPNTHYDYLDLFNVRAQGVYLVLIEHTSATEFDPNATDETTDNNPIYQLWAPLRDINYDVAFSVTGSIEGATEPILLSQIVLPRPISMASGLSGGYAFLATATDTETLDLSIAHNGSPIGTITFEPGVGTDTDGGQFGTISFPNSISFAAGDRIGIFGPTSTDVAATDLSVTLPATRTDL